ncbi:zinc finger MYND domain-containing protein 15-like [Liolophura sinensis]|uniref:zinc finger MYND domain-containing protein 15-like n=1 Tax=Liolophura sinensis TaxID=3198878 RepID=UPI00315876AD
MDDQSSYVLPQAQSTLTSPPTTPVPLTSPLRDWAEYYSWRGLDVDSPVAQLLSYPLSVYYILTTCLKQDNSKYFESLLRKDTLRILLLGVEKEVELLPVFKELVNLLPWVSIHIDMVGKSISKKCRRKILEDGQLSIALFRGDYHSWDGQEAGIIIGLNAGIAAYRCWQPTLEKILKQNTPSYFTDYCEYFVDITDQTLKGANSGEVTQKRLNPFRAPFRITSEDNYLPWFSNAVIFSVTPR